MSRLNTVENVEQVAASVRAQAGGAVVVLSTVFVLRLAGIIDLSDLVLISLIWVSADRFRQASRVSSRERGRAATRYVDVRLN